MTDNNDNDNTYRCGKHGRVTLTHRQIEAAGDLPFTCPNGDCGRALQDTERKTRSREAWKGSVAGRDSL